MPELPRIATLPEPFDVDASPTTDDTARSTVVMFVLNDVTKDARVLKEAGTLVEAGYDVTVMGLWPADSRLPEHEVRPEGFTIIRTPYPVGREWWRPHPNYVGVLLRRLQSRATRGRYRLARRRRLTAAAVRRAEQRVARRRRIVASRLRRMRYHGWRRARLILASARRIRYHVVRRRTLVLAAARRGRHHVRRRRVFFLADSRRGRYGRMLEAAVTALELVGALLPPSPARRDGARALRHGRRHDRRRERRAFDRRAAALGSRSGRRSAARGRQRGRSGRDGRSSGREVLLSRARRPRDARAAGWWHAVAAGRRDDPVRRRSPLAAGVGLASRARELVRRTTSEATRPVSIARVAAGATAPSPRHRGGGRHARRLLALLLLPVRRTTFFVWSCTYATLHVVTGGHLDWVLRLRYRWDGWGRAAAARAPLADVWHAHDLSGLFGAMQAARRNNAPVVYDSHEIMLESSGFAIRPRWARWFLARIERRWAARATAVVTVNSMLAGELGERLAPRRTVVVYNCPPAQQRLSDGTVDLLRSAAGIAPGTPVALYHGGLMLHRGCEQLAQALLQPGMDRVHAVLLGYGGQRDNFVELARDPVFAGRLHVLDAVPPDELGRWIATADVAVMPIQASTLNHRLSTPNKLFEAIGAGVPVVGSDFEGFRDVVYANPAGPLGHLCEPNDVRAIARGIREILDLRPEERQAMKRRCIEATRERWNWERESQALVALYRDLAAPRGVVSQEARARGFSNEAAVAA